MNNNISLLSAFWSMMLRDRRPITPNTDIGGDFNNWLGAPVLLEADDIRCLVGPGGYLRDREGPLVLRPIFCRHLGAVLSFTYWCEDLKWIHSFPFPAEGDFLRYDSTGYTKIMLKIYKKRKLRKNLLWIKLRDGGTAHSPGKSPGSFWAPSCVAVGIPHIDIRIVRLPSSLKRRVCQAENTIKQASCQKKHIQDVGYTDIPVSFGRDGGFICTHRVPWSRGVAAFDAHASRYEAMNVVWFRFLCNLHVVHFQPADPHVLFCILYVHFFWGFGQRIVAQLFFFSLDFFRGPHHLPRLKVLFLPGKNQKPEIFTPEAFSGMPRNLLLRVLSGVRPQKPQTPQAQRLHFHHFQNFQMMLWGNEEPPQFLVGFL